MHFVLLFVIIKVNIIIATIAMMRRGDTLELQLPRESCRRLPSVILNVFEFPLPGMHMLLSFHINEFS